METLRHIAWLVLGWPLKMLYLHGPSLAGFGFWEGRTEDDICGMLTQVESRWWSETDDRMAECIRLIERKFYSFEVTVGVLAYFSILFYVIIYCMCLLCCSGPLKGSRGGKFISD